jgi:hypothetical protein
MRERKIRREEKKREGRKEGKREGKRNWKHEKISSTMLTVLFSVVAFHIPNNISSFICIFLKDHTFL